MLDIEGPVVVMAAGRQGDVRAESVPDLLVGLLGLAEPQIQTLFNIRTQHVPQNLLALIDLRGRNLDAFLLKQDAQFAPQELRVRFREGATLVQAGEDYLQRLLHALAQHLRWRRRRGGQYVCHRCFLILACWPLSDFAWRRGAEPDAGDQP